jgi:hypothetical protein
MLIERSRSLIVAAEGAGYYSPDSTIEGENAVRASPSQPSEVAGVSSSASGMRASIDGEQEYMRHKLSPNCEVRLLVKGTLTAPELRKT